MFFNKNVKLKYYVINLIGILLYFFIFQILLIFNDNEYMLLLLFLLLLVLFGIISYIITTNNINVKYGKITFNNICLIGLIMNIRYFIEAIVLYINDQKFVIGGTWISFDFEWWSAALFGALIFIIFLIIGILCWLYIWCVTTITKKIKNKEVI